MIVRQPFFDFTEKDSWSGRSESASQDYCRPASKPGMRNEIWTVGNQIVY